MLTAILLLCTFVGLAQSPDAGRQVFVGRCAGCHGRDGNGGELGLTPMEWQAGKGFMGGSFKW